jgi:hypothetical protein
MSIVADASVQRLSERIAQVARHSVLVVAGPPRCGKTMLLKATSDARSGRYLDVTAELLPTLPSGMLGVFGPTEFRRWITDVVRATEGELYVDEIEALLSTFKASLVEATFTLLRTIESRRPVILATRLERQLNQSSFPSERIVRYDSVGEVT